MIKSVVFYFLLFITLSNHVVAQIDATDFIEEDINGNSHALFLDYLNKNKTVIIDISATWCGPCWSLHQNHYLEFIQQAFGPNGTDELQVLFFDLDPETDLDDVYGIGDYTLGDWTENITYPIFNPEEINPSITDTYLDGGYPTLNIVCSQTKTSFNSLINAWSTYDEIINAIKTCNPLSETAELTISLNQAKKQFCGDRFEMLVDVYSIGNLPTSSFEVVAKNINGEIIVSKTYEGTLNPSEKVTLNLGNYITESDSEVISYEIINNSSDKNIINNSFHQEFEKSLKFTDQKITVNITTDQFAELDNNRWTIKDGNSEIIIQGPPLMNETTYNEEFELPAAGCYYFEIVDDYGNGFLSDALLEVIDSKGNIIFDETNFYFKGTAYFNVEETNSANEYELSDDLVVYPNVLTDNSFSVKTFDKTQEIQSVHFTDMNGRLIHSWNFGRENYNTTKKFQIRNLTAGTYFITIITNQNIITKKVIKI